MTVTVCVCVCGQPSHGSGSQSVGLLSQAVARHGSEGTDWVCTDMRAIGRGWNGRAGVVRHTRGWVGGWVGGASAGGRW